MNQVLSILVQAAEVGQKAGAYDLQSAGVIAQAVKLATDQLKAEQEASNEAPAEEAPKKK